MSNEPIHLVKITLQTERLAALAKARGLPMRELDDGYLAHSVLRELWQDRAPQPFALRPRKSVVEVWGYGTTSGESLAEHARSFGDPVLLRVLSSPDEVASRPVPVLPEGRVVGFQVRVCPVVRLASARGNFKKGAEIDAFIAKTLTVESTEPVDREAVYREWFLQRWGAPDVTGAEVTSVRVVRYHRERVLRRTQGISREARSLDRPEVELAGELRVRDGAALVARLARGVGRHKAFGFGALLLVPPGREQEG